jgi:hypothetical protein
VAASAERGQTKIHAFPDAPIPRIDNSAERYLLAALNLNGYGAVEHLRISPLEFGLEERKRVWATAQALHALGQPSSFLGIAAKLGGDPQEILRMGSDDGCNPIGAVLDDCRYRLRECYLLRRRAEIGTALASGDLTAEEAASSLQRLIHAAGAADLGEMLDARRLDDTVQPERPEPVFRMNGIPLGTAGNLLNIQAQSKAGKTALVHAMLVSMLGGGGDCLGIASGNAASQAVIHFDTEQSPYDHHAGIRRAMLRAGVEKLPPWLRSYRLADLPTALRREALRIELRRASRAHGGIRAVFIDGVADLCADPNDPVEAFDLVEELHRLAIEFGVLIITVLHENPGSEIGKTRGHLGSQLERKAETNLRAVKDSDGITTVYTERSRNCHIPKSDGARFEWDVEAGMHVSVEGPPVDRRKRAATERISFLAGEVFNRSGGLRYTEAISGIQRTASVQRRRAEIIFTEMRKAAVIRQNLAQLWELTA